MESVGDLLENLDYWAVEGTKRLNGLLKKISEFIPVVFLLSPGNKEYLIGEELV